jgi:hypothetical protein
LSEKLSVPSDELLGLSRFVSRETEVIANDLIAKMDLEAIEFLPVRFFNREEITKACIETNCSVDAREFTCAELNGVQLQYLWFSDKVLLHEVVAECFDVEFNRFSTLRMFGLFDGRCSIISQMNFSRKFGEFANIDCDSVVSRIGEGNLYVDVDGVYYLKNLNRFISDGFVSEDENRRNLDFISQMTNFNVGRFIGD